MAWCQPGDKPLSEPMMVRLPTHICVTQPQWVNESLIHYSTLWYCHLWFSFLNLEIPDTDQKENSFIFNWLPLAISFCHLQKYPGAETVWRSTLIKVGIPIVEIRLSYGCLISKMELPIQIMILTHWGRVIHICIGNLTIIVSDDGLSPGWRKAIIWNNAGILLIGSLGTNFSEILIGIQSFSFKKMHLKMSSWKLRPLCLGLNGAWTKGLTFCRYL